MSNKPILPAFLTLILIATVLTAASFIPSIRIPIYVAKVTQSTENVRDYLAGVFFTPSITVADLMKSSSVADQGGQKVKILIMPGHEPTFGGAEYRDLKERDIVVKIADDLAGFLNGDENIGRYDVTVARDTKEWNPIFQNYFTEEWPTLPAWVAQYKSTMVQLEANGQVTKAVGEVDHHDTLPDPALRLYAINKWVDENNIDIAIHIHVNDYPRSDTSRPGKYTGFAIYVPEHQYSNAGATKPVADDIFKRLSTYFPVSDMRLESAGVLEDQDLIAVGSNNTVNAVSMLIEYSYIYEQMFSTPAMQDIAAKELAFQTYLGLEDFFGKGNIAGNGAGNTTGNTGNLSSSNLSSSNLSSNVTTLPYTWNKDFHQGDGPDPDIFAMQVALMQKGYYPPAGKSQNDCSLTGTLGPCTMMALADFQKDNGIGAASSSSGTTSTTNKTGGIGTTSETFFGPQTRAVFNKLFSGEGI